MSEHPKTPPPASTDDKPIRCQTCGRVAVPKLDEDGLGVAVCTATPGGPIKTTLIAANRTF